MNQRTVLLVLSAIVAGFLLFNGAPEMKNVHNLITAEKAEAFKLFTEWQIKQGKTYREIEVSLILLRKLPTGLESSLKTISL